MMMPDDFLEAMDKADAEIKDAQIAHRTPLPLGAVLRTDVYNELWDDLSGAAYERAGSEPALDEFGELNIPADRALDPDYVLDINEDDWRELLQNFRVRIRDAVVLRNQAWLDKRGAGETMADRDAVLAEIEHEIYD